MIERAVLEEFAKRVLKVARSVTGAGRWGRKVYVSDVWEAARKADPGWIGKMSEGQFKMLLGECNRLGLVQLSRADLVQVLDQERLRKSQIDWYGLAEFHFLLAEPE